MSMYEPAAGRFAQLQYEGGVTSILEILVKWPLLALDQVQNGGYIPTALALGAAYYVGGMPGQGQSLRTYAMAYAAGGVGMYAGLMVGMPSPQKVAARK